MSHNIEWFHPCPRHVQQSRWTVFVPVRDKLMSKWLCDVPGPSMLEIHAQATTCMPSAAGDWRTQQRPLNELLRTINSSSVMSIQMPCCASPRPHLALDMTLAVELRSTARPTTTPALKPRANPHRHVNCCSTSRWLRQLD